MNGLDRPIDLNEFEKERKENLLKYEEERNKEVDRIFAITQKSELEIIKGYFFDIREDYRTAKKISSSPLEKGEKNNTAEAIEQIRLETDRCMDYLSGNKDADLSFIEDLYYKRTYDGMSKEEIAKSLDETHLEYDGEDLEEDNYYRTLASYAPTRDRIKAIRDYEDLEKGKSSGIKGKLDQLMNGKYERERENAAQRAKADLENAGLYEDAMEMMRRYDEKMAKLFGEEEALGRQK